LRAAHALERSSNTLNSSGASSPGRQAALEHYQVLSQLGKALSSPVRLRILDLLRQGAHHVEAVALATGESVANSSQHLQQMRAARLVAAERQGNRVEYRLAGEEVSLLFGGLRSLAERVLPEMDRLRRELGALEPQEREALLARIRRREVTLLDVRPAREYAAAHLPGALSIPLDELPRRIREIPPGREVVAYCRGPYCPMALEAVAFLASSGIPARHLDLGVPDLRRRLRAHPTAPERRGARTDP
jgi:DNA-binding transcriptional ArsR family regulator/rhodanese-related sulfurtransferase